MLAIALLRYDGVDALRPGCMWHARAPVTHSRARVAEMGIYEDIRAKIKVAMKGGPAMKQELQALRLVSAAMMTKCKENGAEALSDEDAQVVLSKLAKMRKVRARGTHEERTRRGGAVGRKGGARALGRRAPAPPPQESIDMFEAGGKLEAAAAERYELGLIEGYLPKMAGEDAVRGWIAEAILVACPDGPDKSKMGQVSRLGGLGAGAVGLRGGGWVWSGREPATLSRLARRSCAGGGWGHGGPAVPRRPAIHARPGARGRHPGDVGASEGPNGRGWYGPPASRTQPH